MSSFQHTQRVFTEYIRNPQQSPLPTSTDARRMGIYCDLVFNTIANLIAGVFPVLRSLLSQEEWQQLLRQFIKEHPCHTPYFLEVSEEFLLYLRHAGSLQERFPFVLALSHYEWIELALDVSETELPPRAELAENILNHCFYLSPLAVALEYQYPVHTISVNNVPLQQELTCLVVYRDREDRVQFMHVTPLALRLIYSIQDNPGVALKFLWDKLSPDTPSVQPDHWHSLAISLVKDLCARDVLFPGVNPCA